MVVNFPIYKHQIRVTWGACDEFMGTCNIIVFSFWDAYSLTLAKATLFWKDEDLDILNACYYMPYSSFLSIVSDKTWG